jgi:hypothetical protein
LHLIDIVIALQIGALIGWIFTNLRKNQADFTKNIFIGAIGGLLFCALCLIIVLIFDANLNQILLDIFSAFCGAICASYLSRKF